MLTNTDWLTQPRSRRSEAREHFPLNETDELPTFPALQNTSYRVSAPLEPLIFKAKFGKEDSRKKKIPSDHMSEPGRLILS